MPDANASFQQDLGVVLSDPQHLTRLLSLLNHPAEKIFHRSKHWTITTSLVRYTLEKVLRSTNAQTVTHTLEQVLTSTQWPQSTLEDVAQACHWSSGILLETALDPKRSPEEVLELVQRMITIDTVAQNSHLEIFAPIYGIRTLEEYLDLIQVLIGLSDISIPSNLYAWLSGKLTIAIDNDFSANEPNHLSKIIDRITAAQSKILGAVLNPQISVTQRELVRIWISLEQIKGN